VDDAKLTAAFIAAAKEAEAKGLVIPWAQILALLSSLASNPALIQLILTLLGGLIPATPKT
jgi:hypothetical protein